jgi:hypothetical protein
VARQRLERPGEAALRPSPWFGSGETCLLRHVFLYAGEADFICDWENRAQRSSNSELTRRSSRGVPVHEKQATASGRSLSDVTIRSGRAVRIELGGDFLGRSHHDQRWGIGVDPVLRAETNN